MKKNFVLILFLGFLLISCGYEFSTGIVNSPKETKFIADIKATPQKSTVEIENKTTLTNIPSQKTIAEKTPAQKSLISTSASKTSATSISTSTPFFQLETSKGLFIVAKIGKTLNVFDMKDNTVLPLVTINNNFSLPTMMNKKIIYTTGNDISVYDLMTNKRIPIKVLPNAQINHPVLFPDEMKVLYSTNIINIADNQGSASNWSNLFVVDLQNNEIYTSVFQNNKNNKTNAEISPDSKWIVFQSDKNREFGANDLYIVESGCIFSDSNCDDKEKRLTFGLGENSAKYPKWAPNGEDIVFECIVEEKIVGSNGAESIKLQSDICVINVKNPVIRNLTNTSSVDESFPNWSPDDQFIGFSSIFYDEQVHKYITELSLYRITTGEKDQITNTPNEDELFSFWLNID
jgi:dipeptidyl aminopeptidase/acylaminoacyl peptidase